VRRGDYVQNPVTNARHGLCPLEYYHTAVRTLAAQVPDPQFFVFSDDPDWTQQNLKLPYPTTYVTCNGLERDYEDLRLMSHCRHHIIANSSFSWWGAWLSTFPAKTVLAPSTWFREPPQASRDRVPAGWLTV
jgi:hypothetical protein